MAAKQTGKGSGALKAVEAAAALAGVAAAAGYYFYGTKNAKKHRQAASAWAKNMKKDVHVRVKNLKKIDAKSVAKVVDEAAKAYASVKGASVADVAAAAKELKANWKSIQTELAPSAKVKNAVKAVKPSNVKKVVKKTEKKAVKAVKKAVKKATKK